MVIKDRYFVKIVPQRGDVVHRFVLTRRHIFAAAGIVGAIVLGSLLFGVFQMWHAHAQVAALQQIATQQQAQLKAIDSKTATIRTQLQKAQSSITQTQALIGIRTPIKKMGAIRHNLDALAGEAEQTLEQSDALRRMTMHVLNVRHLRELARAQELASIPSIDPVDGAAIVGCFCYRSYPDSEFHPGVDLSADYGDVVHASAAGTVATADYDGGYGEKIDIDHGNGYHTWYAHLSKMEVAPGQYVHKGQEIGLVGSTGYSTGPHLHYQVMLNGTAIDPSPFLNGVPPKVLASLP